MMKEKLINRIMGVFLASTLAMSMVACGDEKAPANSSETTANTETAGTAATETQTAEDEVVVPTYPIATDDTLSVWFSNNIGLATGISSFEESPFHSGLEEKTGVKVEWQTKVEGANANQAYNLLLTESTLPDIIYHTITQADADILIADGVIYDLTEYIPKYAPDYYEFLVNNGDALKNVMTAEGRLYGFNALKEGAFNDTYIGPCIRKDWLDACGLDVPVTLEDWEKVLVAFKEKYGVAMGFSTTRFLNQAGIASGTGAYATAKYTLYVDDNDKIQLAQVQPEWKEYMEVLNRWYENGLIDKDSLNADDKAIRTKVANNEIGISVTAMSQMTLFIQDAEANNTGAEWIGIEYPRTAAGEATSMIQTAAPYINNNCCVITTSCPEEKLITALQWLNYGYTKEGRMYWNYGEEGVSYIVDANGNVQWTDTILNDEAGLAVAVDKYGRARNAGITVQDAHLVALVNNENSAAAVEKWINNTEAAEHYVPRISLTEEETMRYSDLTTAISTRVNEMALKYIAGEESLDNFDAFVAELEGMGLKEALEIQQAAYDRWLANE